jgi:uncharacterized membrane protein
MENLWGQIIALAGAVIVLLGGFTAIAASIKKTTGEAVKRAEEKFEQKLEERKSEQLMEHQQRASEQKEVCAAQFKITDRMNSLFNEYHKKQIRQAEMQFACHFTTLEALNKIAHKETINGEIETQLDELKKFMICESTN